jgi:hypothetical protein
MWNPGCRCWFQCQLELVANFELHYRSLRRRLPHLAAADVPAGGFSGQLYLPIAPVDVGSSLECPLPYLSPTPHPFGMQPCWPLSCRAEIAT